MNIHYDSRRKTYVCDFKLRGQRMRLTVNASNERTAWVMVPDLIAEEVLRGLTAAPKRDESPRLADFIGPWLEQAAAHAPASGKTYSARCVSLSRILGDLTLASIDDAALTRYITARRAEGITPQSINDNLVMLGMILSTAQKRGLIAKAPEIRKIKADKKARMPLTKDQVEAFFANLDPFFRDAALFAYRTGARRQEVCKARWSDIHGEGAERVIVIHGKGSKERVIPLTPEALEVIDRLPKAIDGSEIFPMNYGSFGNAVADAMRKIGLSGSRHGLHSLRRTMGTELYRAGASVNGLQELYGHTSEAVTRRYISGSVEFVRQALLAGRGTGMKTGTVGVNIPSGNVGAV